MTDNVAISFAVRFDFRLLKQKYRIVVLAVCPQTSKNSTQIDNRAQVDLEVNFAE